MAAHLGCASDTKGGGGAGKRVGEESARDARKAVVEVDLGSREVDLQQTVGEG